jgi:tight adherence protein C
MNIAYLIESGGLLWSPLSFAVLIGFATALVWLAFSPAQPVRLVRERLEDFVDRGDVVEETDVRGPFVARVIWPLVLRLLRLVGTLAPRRNLESTRQMLLQAGHPGALTALDFLGLRLLLFLSLGGGYFLSLGKTLPFAKGVQNALIAGGLGFFAPLFWLRSRARRRKRQITRALPDALDMLTIGVEAGLAFESALVRVGEQWDNALTREFRRAVTEIRVGTPRDVALQRVVERAGVPDLSTFVAVLIQSSQLGVSIAQVLHAQAAQMRIRRRQRAEELARKAAIKMIFPLAILIFPSMLVVILGPSVPAFLSFFSGPGGRAIFVR